MRLIDHQPRIIAALQPDQPARSQIAVHAVEAFDDDEGASVPPAVQPQRALKRLHVAVRAKDPLGAGELGALHDAVVDQRICDNQILRPQQATDHRDVGRVAAHKGDGVLDTMQTGQCRLELAMHGTLARR